MLELQTNCLVMGPISFCSRGNWIKWWVPEQADGEYMAIGVWGQYIYVYPKENLVIVKTSVDPNYTKPKYDYESIAVFRSIANHLRS
jgi:CubicO group peptidase (beta-lactamase class C family)